MPLTPAEFVPLIEAKSILRNNWVTDLDPNINEANYQAHQKQWYDLIATADATWLPSLVVLTHDPPISPNDDYLRDTWAMDIGQIYAIIAKTQPSLVIETLIGELDPSGEPQAIIVALRDVGEAIRNLPSAAGNLDVDQIKLSNRIVVAISPLVDCLYLKTDDYIMTFIDMLGEDIGKAAQGLLHQIAALTPPGREAVQREISLYMDK